MLQKQIKVHVHAGKLDAFLERQKEWNDVMSQEPGFIDVRVSLNPDEPDNVYISATWDSQEALDGFMAGAHDRVRDLTAIDECYDGIEVQVLQVVNPTPQDFRMDEAPSRASEPYQIVLLSEIYRVSCILRSTIISGVCDQVEANGSSLIDLARRCDLRPDYLRRLLEALASLNLVVLDGDNVRLRRLACQYLRRDSSGYLGHLILHNTRPHLWRSWGDLTGRLGVSEPQRGSDHEQFIRAMEEIADAGQTQALLSATDLGGRRRLLDVGAGPGSHSIGFCQRYPQLSADLLDLEETAPIAQNNIRLSGLSDRIRFVTGDYHRDLPEHGYDVVLISNILRGEQAEHARQLLARARDRLESKGLLLVQDLMPNNAPGIGTLSATMFGLHLLDGANASEETLREWLTDLGFTQLRTKVLDEYVVSNRLLTAIRP